MTDLIFAESSSTANPLKELSTSRILHNNTQMGWSQNHLQNWNHMLNNLKTWHSLSASATTQQ